MKLKRILKRVLKWTSLAILLALFAGIVFLFIAYWRSTNDCDQLTAAQGDTMKAIVYCDFGSPDVLKLEDVEKPVPNDHQLLVKVRVAAVNPLDWHVMRGTPYIARAMGMGLRKPKSTRMGVDYAGTVEAVGKNVTEFKPGDEVFGGRDGAFAEYLCPRADCGSWLGFALFPLFSRWLTLRLPGLKEGKKRRERAFLSPTPDSDLFYRGEAGKMPPTCQSK